LGSRTGAALEEDEAGAELESVADGDDDAEDLAPADFEDELEQPVRERAAATTAIAPVVREERYLTMTPSVSGYGTMKRRNGHSRSCRYRGTGGNRLPIPAFNINGLMEMRSGRDSPLTTETLTRNFSEATRCSFLRRCFSSLWRRF